MDLAAVVERADGLRRWKPASLPVLIGIEGCGGAGKSTAAARLGESLADSHVVHMDDFLIKRKVAAPTWLDGMFDRRRLEEQVLLPASTGASIAYERLVWEDDVLSEPVALPPARFVIVEGIACYFDELEHYYDLKVWIDVPIDVASGRGRERDGSHENAGHWDVWAANDADYLRLHRPDTRADLVVLNPTAVDGATR